MFGSIAVGRCDGLDDFCDLLGHRRVDVEAGGGDVDPGAQGCCVVLWRSLRNQLEDAIIECSSRLAFE